MSPRWRVLSAVLVAACMAAAIPATAFAVGPNQLANPRVSPGSGSTSTVFTFAVDYASEKGFAATSVVALVAWRSVVLGLTSGTSTGGTYAGTSTLPAGTWSVTFEARATQGPSPSVAGPTVAVTAPTPVAPPPPPPPAVLPPTPAPPATPGPQAPDTTPAPVPQPAASSTTSAAPSSGAASPTPRQVDASPSESPRGAGPLGSSASGLPGVAGRVDPTNTSRPDTGLLPSWLLVTIAALGLVASFLLMAARRGRDRDEQPHVGTGETLPGPPVSLAARGSRRTVQLSHTEDPILAAMGIGEPDRPNPVATPMSRRVRSGPGERLE